MAKERLTRDEQRAQSREKAKADLIVKQRKQKMRKIFIQVGSIVGGLAVVGLIGLIVFNMNRPGVSQVNPENMISNGVILGKDLKVETSAAIPAGGKAVYPELSDNNVSVVVYADYLCPFCKAFEDGSRSTIEDLLKKGNVTVEYRTVSFLSEYSAVAANASACIAAKQPDLWWDANNALYVSQPDEVEAKNFQKKTSLKTVKAILSPLNLSDVTNTCINDMPYFGWAQTVSAEANTITIPNTDGEKITGTPTIIIDGKRFTGGSAAEFKTAVDAALAAKGL